MRTRNEEGNSLDCVKSRTAGSGFEKGISSARGKAEKTRGHGGIIRGEKEDDDTDEGDGFDDFQEEVCDDRTGEVLDAKDACWAKDGRSSHEHQVGSREPRYVVQPHRDGQACREGLQNERNLCLQPCRHWRQRNCCSACAPRSRSFIAKAKAAVDVH